jgi:hypothetical protein
LFTFYVFTSCINGTGRKEGWEEGRKDGWKEGREGGRMKGREEGRKVGRKGGRKEGWKGGRMDGRKEGRREGRHDRGKDVSKKEKNSNYRTHFSNGVMCFLAVCGDSDDDDACLQRAVRSVFNLSVSALYRNLIET